MHGKVPSSESCVKRPQSLSRAHVVGAVSDVKHSLEGHPAALLFPARPILPEDRLLAHVVGTAGAGMRVEGEEHKASGVVKAARVGENLPEKIAHASVLQPGFDEVRVGVGDHHQLKVVPAASQKLEELQNAGSRWDLLHSRVDGFLGDALICHVRQDLLRVLVVLAFPVAVCQPGGEPLIRQSPHRRVVAVFTNDGLVKVKQNQEARVWSC